jgi:hypothetical protein
VDTVGPGTTTTTSPACFSAYTLTRTLVEATARALRQVDCADLGQARDWAGRTEDVTMSAGRADDVDADAVAGWIVEQYAGSDHPGVVVGSAHGGAVHLATALGVPWLPAAFETDFRWSDGLTDGAAAMSLGRSLAARIIGANPGVTVRQVHDPARLSDGIGGRLNLHQRWKVLPEPYRRFLSDRVRRGGFVLLLRDVRPWSVLDHGDGYAFQIGSSASGLDLRAYAQGPDLRSLVRRTGGNASWPPGQYRRQLVEQSVESGFEAGLGRWAVAADARLYPVLYHGSDALSAATADICREWLVDHGKAGDRLLVGAGRLLDPWSTFRAGLVPYWCDAVTRAAVGAVELWLAGSPAYSSVEILPEPPGTSWSQLAPMGQWSVLAQFATRRGVVSSAIAHAYPLRPVPPRLAAEALRRLPHDLPVPGPVSLDAVLAGLKVNAATNGILMSYGSGD